MGNSNSISFYSLADTTEIAYRWTYLAFQEIQYAYIFALKWWIQIIHSSVYANQLR